MRGWRCEGAAGSTLRGRRWTCKFTDNTDRCYLRWGTSAFGKPQALRLTVIGDGSGHELRAEFGSHFQHFERTLGTPYARGVFFSITPCPGKDEMVRAIMEGITQELRRRLEIVDNAGHTVEVIYQSGGGANSDVCSHIKADIY